MTGPGATWLAGALSRLRPRRAVHAEAAALRLAALQCAPGSPDLPLDELPDDLLPLLDALDLPDPRGALARSLAATDAVVLPGDLSPLERVDLVGALHERELWALPDGAGLVRNLVLARHAGVYLTPAPVAHHLALRVLGPPLAAAIDAGDAAAVARASTPVVVDPACGAGAFLVAAVVVLEEGLEVARRAGIAGLPELGAWRREQVRRRLFGVERLPRLARAARRVLAELAAVSEEEVVGVRAGDGLVTDPAVAGGPVVPLPPADVVLMNPPYGRLRVLRSDFAEASRAFAPHADVDALIAGRKRWLSAVGEHLRGRPELAVARGGVPDWQRLFLARGLALLRPGGALGALIPASVVADRSARDLRRHLLLDIGVERVDRIAEAGRLFVDVNQPTCLLVARHGARDPTLSGPSRSLPPEAEVRVPLAAVRRLSPQGLVLPAADAAGWRMLDHLHRHPRLGDLAAVRNLRGECDLTVHKRFVGAGPDRLVRGDHIERFVDRVDADRVGTIDKAGFIAALGGSDKAAHVERWRLVGRQCAYLGKERRLSFTLLPPGPVVANTCNYLLWDGPEQENHLLGLLAWLSCSLVGWRLDLTASNNHVNNYELDDLPVPVGALPSLAPQARVLLAHYAGQAFGASARPTGPLEAALDEACAAVV
ncbi:MAG: N-6 DNA methylase [Alphaproteobacteria bacterium]|nr:N-6 DNA methylase [Alphaproteobacteria bacterium]